MMLRKFRLHFSAMITALVLVSVLFSSNAKACEEEPQTFLSLYMNSNLVVTARFDSESKPIKSNEDEYGYTLDSERNLVFTKIYKGQTELESVSLDYSQYVSNPNQDTTENEQNVDEHYYFDFSKIKVGKEYLFFLTQNKEDGKYYVTDYVSGVREIEKNLSFYEKNLSELGRIVAAKSNQYELLTEWIVKNIENAETREDGIGDLSESFYGLTYQDEDPIFKGKGPFVVTEEGYGVYTVGVAKHLTQTQKDRVSNVLYPMLEKAWTAEKPQYVNYGISAILGGIDKPRLANFTYNSLQSVGKKDNQRKSMITDFLVNAIGDGELSSLYYELQEIEYQIEEAKNDNTPQGKKQLKDLTILKDTKSKNFDKRFKFLQSKNFVIESTES
ncbi:MAG TPA: hypothetical protein PKE69_04725 [Pyrinomonadaceae bacterium]|nr:hypothetical protein [Pyrinomonadaceae bacterium]